MGYFEASLFSKTNFEKSSCKDSEAPHIVGAEGAMVHFHILLPVVQKKTLFVTSCGK